MSKAKRNGPGRPVTSHHSVDMDGKSDTVAPRSDVTKSIQCSYQFYALQRHSMLPCRYHSDGRPCQTADINQEGFLWIVTEDTV